MLIFNRHFCFCSVGIDWISVRNHATPHGCSHGRRSDDAGVFEIWWPLLESDDFATACVHIATRGCVTFIAGNAYGFVFIKCHRDSPSDIQAAKSTAQHTRIAWNPPWALTACFGRSSIGKARPTRDDKHAIQPAPAVECRLRPEEGVWDSALASAVCTPRTCPIAQMPFLD